MKAWAQEDEVEGEEDDLTDDDEVNVDDGTGAEIETAEGGEEEEEEEEEATAKGSPDADTNYLLANFVLDAIDASFRYPMDFNFYIQNFTAIPYNRAVKPRQEATVMYSFYPAEAFAARPLGLTVNLAYHDADGNSFLEAVFNQTVSIVELDEGMDGETFFLYLFMLAFSVLLLVAGHHFLSSFGRKKGSKKAVVEVGTGKRDDVDYDWLPKEVLNEIKKTPRQSPRQRKANRDASSK
ncbi:Translocon-associated protein subunit alpha-like [Homarus americanus]|uniref:Translocon-associated protein subunit alpha n=1 Tax=Homarus americanus TaxID=6706 RepID=A0A8J5K0J1_HOMAM|nr:Translocon-associated protein subunit alpha-like [Homarus americanus]